MEDVMKMLLATVALSAVIASPTFGQTRQARAPSYDPPQTTYPNHPRRMVSQREAARRPCAAYTSMRGCLGWDPDPRVRMMLQMDAGMDDY
jgi:hypothetical protein